jgi:hypothetical protein
MSFSLNWLYASFSRKLTDHFQENYMHHFQRPSLFRTYMDNFFGTPNYYYKHHFQEN